MKVINGFCKAVLANIRFEHTTLGVKIFFNGVDEEKSYRIVSDVSTFYRSLAIIETFLISRIYLRRRHKKKVTAELALQQMLRQQRAILILQCFVRALLAKQRVAMMQMLFIFTAPKKKGLAHLKKMSSIAMTKLNILLSQHCIFRGMEVTIAGKFFRYQENWYLLVHAEEGHHQIVSGVRCTGNVPITGQIGWPLNAQTIVDEDNLRYMCGNIEELQGKDLVDMDALLTTRLHRLLVFNALPNFIDVVTSKQKGRMAVKLLKYIEL